MMPRILITGGNGGLGRALVPLLMPEPVQLRIMSRAPRPAELHARLEWAQADLATGQGLDTAMQDVDIVAHLGSSAIHKNFETDVEGTQRLLMLAHRQQIRNFVYVSIVGIEHFPRYPYYQSKLAAEQQIEGSGLPYTIVRATQFHSLIDTLLNLVNRLPFLLLPVDALFQPVETGEVAAILAGHILAPPDGRAPDIGGPEIHSIKALAEAWLRQRNINKRVINLPLPDWAYSTGSYRQGLNTAPSQAVGNCTWAMWLAQQYPRAAR